MRNFNDFEKMVIQNIVKCFEEGQGPFLNFADLLSSSLLTNYDFILVDENYIGDAYICYNDQLDNDAKNDGIYQIFSMLFLIDWLETEKYISFISDNIGHTDKLIARDFHFKMYDNTNGKFYGLKTNGSNMDGYYQRTSINPMQGFTKLDKYEKQGYGYNLTLSFDVQKISFQNNIMPILMKVLYSKFVVNYSLVTFVNNDFKSFEEIEAEKSHNEAKKAIIEAQTANKLSQESIKKADISIEKANIGNNRALKALYVAIIVGGLQIIIGLLQIIPGLFLKDFIKQQIKNEISESELKTIINNKSIEKVNKDPYTDEKMIISGTISNSTIIIERQKTKNESGKNAKLEEKAEKQIAENGRTEMNGQEIEQITENEPEEKTDKESEKKTEKEAEQKIEQKTLEETEQKAEVEKQRK